MIRERTFRTSHQNPWDYRHWLASYKPSLLENGCKNLFVATDNIECLNYCRTLFPFNLFSFSAFSIDAVSS